MVYVRFKLNSKLVKGSLRASSPFGGYHEQKMHKRYTRGDTKAGGAGEALKLLLTHTFSPGLLRSLKQESLLTG